MKTTYQSRKGLTVVKTLFLFTLLFVSTSSFGQVVADFEMSGLCCSSDLSGLPVTNKSTVDTGDLTYKWSYTYTNGTDIGDDSLHCDSSYLVKLVATSSIRGSDSLTRKLRVEEEVDASFTFDTEPFSWTVNVFGPDGNDEYRWTFGDGGRTSTKDATYKYVNADPGVFTICLATKKGDCWSQSCDEIKFTVGVNDISYLGIEIYPNPSTGLFTIKNKNSENYTIQVLDVFGHAVNFSQTGNVIDISELENGIYTLELKGENYYVTKKVLLSR